MCTNKLFRMLVLTLLACVLLAVPLHAAAETEGDYSYTVSNGAATITGYTGTVSTILLPPFPQPVRNRIPASSKVIVRRHPYRIGISFVNLHDSFVLF